MRKIWSIVAILFFIGYLIFPLFMHLDTLPLQLWDESLFAMRAYHLVESGSLLPNFNLFPGIPDYPNLKPPLGTLIQAISFKLFGYSILSLRIPAVLFALALIGVFIITSYRITGKYLAGIVASLILVSCTGFIRLHVARTGDQETIILFFLVLQVIYFFLYLEEKKRQYWYLFIVSLIGGFLVKSIFTFFLIPAFLIYSLYKREFRALVSSGRTYIGMITVLLSLLSYYLIMNQIIPGFLNMEIERVFGRYNTVIDNHAQPFYFYLNSFLIHFRFWIPLLLGSLFMLSWIKNTQVKSFVILLWICFSIHIVVISFSTTKLEWYDAILYPLASLLIAFTGLHLPFFKKYLAAFGLIFFGLLGLSYFSTLKTCYFPNTVSQSDNYAYLFERLQKEDIPTGKFTVYCYDYNGQVGFYSRLFNDHYEYDIKVLVYWQEDQIQLGDILMACEEEKINRIKENYTTKVLLEEEGCYLLELLEEK